MKTGEKIVVKVLSHGSPEKEEIAFQVEAVTRNFAWEFTNSFVPKKKNLNQESLKQV